jgi:hypothetical protein
MVFFLLFLPSTNIQTVGEHRVSECSERFTVRAEILSWLEEGGYCDGKAVMAFFVYSLMSLTKGTQSKRNCRSPGGGRLPVWEQGLDVCSESGAWFKARACRVVQALWVSTLSLSGMADIVLKKV